MLGQVEDCPRRPVPGKLPRKGETPKFAISMPSTFSSSNNELRCFKGRRRWLKAFETWDRVLLADAKIGCVTKIKGAFFFGS